MSVAANISAQALDQALAPLLPKSNPQYRARLINQILQLIRHGNYAETFIRTTPEGTDLVNFARLWEYVLVQSDRQTRGYVARSNRDDFEVTRKEFEDCIDFMATKLKSSIERHDLDLAGTNFISRIAQRYQIVDKKRKAPAVEKSEKPEKQEKMAAPTQEKMPDAQGEILAEEKVAASAKAAPKRATKPVAGDTLSELEAL
ncbi:MAG: hypothetical protein COY40_04060 [Alphaproteobacteria bacterium CG_4_10_14_0_8_um_filter_53_9]|nr:MAG: hypothetical protein COY40_04060 [Alphaproteobacteria bacterium CG_4_10_14_0_8_um_filter_53_9]